MDYQKFYQDYFNTKSLDREALVIDLLRSKGVTIYKANYYSIGRKWEVRRNESWYTTPEIFHKDMEKSARLCEERDGCHFQKLSETTYFTYENGVKTLISLETEENNYEN